MADSADSWEVTYCWKGPGRADVYRELFVSALQELFDQTQAVSFDASGDWIDHPDTETALREAGWTVTPPERRKRFFVRISHGPLSALLKGTAPSDLGQALSAGWNDSDRPEVLEVQLLTADPEPGAEATTAFIRTVDPDCVDIGWRDGEVDALNTLLDWMRKQGRARGLTLVTR